MAFLFADLGIYLTIKVVRGDFWWWAPFGRNLEVLSSILGRVIVKVVCDFTSIAQLRHPNEMGGLQWTLSLLLTLAGLPVAVWIYGREEGHNGAYVGARSLAFVLLSSVAAMLAVFFFTIEARYLKTFLGNKRGKELTVERFRCTTDDTTRSDAIFVNSRHHWKSIEEEVKGWMEMSWQKWDEEKPKWLDGTMRARIPLDLIPSATERVKERIRRGSIEEKGM